MLEHKGLVHNQICAWDVIANMDHVNCDGEADAGCWWPFQREAALEVGPLQSKFGFKVALSADGNRIAMGAPYVLNQQGVAA